MGNDIHAETLIKLDDLRMTIDTGDGLKALVKSSELELPPQTAVGLVGESGSGKTLTISSILGLIPFLPGVTGGQLWMNFGNRENIWFDGPWISGNGHSGRDYFYWQRRLNSRMKKYRGKTISIIFQRAKSSLNPFLKIKDQINESLEMAGDGKSHSRVIEWLSDCGFTAGEAERVADQYPHQLSGGQAQRAVMAVTLSNQAEIIIADEPTTGLDAKLQVETLVFMKKLLDKFKKSAIIISHNLQSLAKFTDTCYVMYKGLTVEKGPTSAILHKGGRNHPYTRKLQGEVETGVNIGQIVVEDIPGCPFFSNCDLFAKLSPDVQARCRDILPPKVDIDKDHFVRCFAFEC